MPRFIGDEITPVFAEEPELDKKTGAPAAFVWRDRQHPISRVIREWHEYDQGRGGAANTGRPPFSQRGVMSRGSWGSGKDFYRVLTDEGRIYDIYYDRRPKGKQRKGRWVIFRDIGDIGETETVE